MEYHYSTVLIFKCRYRKSSNKGAPSVGGGHVHLPAAFTEWKWDHFWLRYRQKRPWTYEVQCERAQAPFIGGGTLIGEFMVGHIPDSTQTTTKGRPLIIWGGWGKMENEFIFFRRKAFWKLFFPTEGLLNFFSWRRPWNFFLRGGLLKFIFFWGVFKIYFFLI